MIHVRELPRLGLHIEAITPTGNRYRWGDDEPNPANIPTGLTFSSTMPGGYEQLDVSLARKAGVDYRDLGRLSTLRVRGAGGAIAWEGRLERTPRVSGDQMAISPSAVGWQAHLDDDKSARQIYVDRDLSRWQGPSAQRNISSALDPLSGPEVLTDPAVGDPALQLSVSGQILGFSGGSGEAWYDAGSGNHIHGVILGASAQQNIAVSVSWVLALYGSDDDHSTGLTAAAVSVTGTTAITTGLYTLPTDKRWLVLQLVFTTTYTGDQKERWRLVKDVAVIGDHSLALPVGADGGRGLYASDIVTHAVGRWAPLLNISGTVQASQFVIPHLTFTDATTAGEIVRQATAFGLQDWGVWDNRTFYWAERGTYGRKWRARIAPAQLSETGPQLDRLWESVIVSYTDVDGSTRTVGPPGSDADTEDAVLHDTDPENPANQLGIIRRDLLSMGTSTAAGAIELGRRFLEEQKLLDTSGQAQLVGHVMDDRGVLHPYWRVRAGDTISFIDASDTSERRIVRASHDHDSRTCTVDLDAPPEGLDALLARLGVVLVPLGVGA